MFIKIKKMETVSCAGGTDLVHYFAKEVNLRERERQRETERDRDRQTDRQSERDR